MQGHDHTYQRSKQLLCVKKDTYDPNCTVNTNGDETVYEKGKGPILVIAGNPGGQSMYDISNSDPEKGYLVKALGNNMGIDFRTGTLGYETGRGIVTYSVSDNELTETYNMTTVQVKGLAFSDSFKITATGTPIPSSSPLPTPITQYYADINKDGKIDLSDIIALVKIVFQ